MATNNIDDDKQEKGSPPRGKAECAHFSLYHLLNLTTMRLLMVVRFFHQWN